MRSQRVDTASDRAHTVVGLYGDPTVSWSIVLHARLRTPVEVDTVARRLAAATLDHPHLGRPPQVLEVPAAELTAQRDRFAGDAYGRGEPLVRAAVCTDEPGLLIAAHHGAVDGLGLLSLLGAALDSEVTSNAAGIGDRKSRGSFLRSAVRRALEAVFAPPSRITPRPAPGPDRDGDVLVRRDHARMRVGTAALTAAAALATHRWNRGRGRSANRVVAAVGASYRSGSTSRPEQDSAFFRFRLPSGVDTDEVARMLGARAPEPDFPARSNGLFRLGALLLARRLGSTFLVSNLGVVTACEQVASLAFYPSASGRSGVAFGAVTLGGVSTLTVRARRRDFDEVAASTLADGLVAQLEGLVGTTTGSELTHE